MQTKTHQSSAAKRKVRIHLPCGYSVARSTSKLACASSLQWANAPAAVPVPSLMVSWTAKSFLTSKPSVSLSLVFVVIYYDYIYTIYIYIVVLKVHTLCGMLQHFAATTLGRRGMPFDNMWASDALRAQMGRFLALSQRF